MQQDKQREIILDNVELLTLREKISAFKMLFDCLYPIVEVKGIFLDKKGNLAFLNYKFYAIDASNIRRRWLTVVCDNELILLTPENDVIAEVRLSF